MLDAPVVFITTITDPSAFLQHCSFPNLLLTYVYFLSQNGYKQNPALADFTSSLSAIPQTLCTRRPPTTLLKLFSSR